MKLKILGHDFRVTQQGRSKLLGRMNTYKGWIKYDPSVATSQIESTLVHESLHAIDDMLDLKLGERRIRLLEVGLVQFLRDNGVSLTPLRKRK